MAGVLNATTVIAERPRQQSPAESKRFQGSQLMEAGVALGGRVFFTQIHQNATPNQLIEKAAKENNGGVAKAYYPELNSWEIVVVRIGGMLLVKNDPKRVAEADFSQFSDPAAMRQMAVSAAFHSKGGIHFGIGTSGIPMGVTKNGDLVFPNGDEMRLGEGTIIGVWDEASTFDPGKLGDMEQKYAPAGGLQISDAARERMGRLADDAQKKMSGAHGDTRTEPLLLDDNLVVLDKETGEIKSASEYAGKIKLEGFAAPQFQIPAYTSVGLILPSEKGPLALPMDGFAGRVPYLVIKMFDGKLTDHLTVRFSPLKAHDAFSPLPWESAQIAQRTKSSSDSASLYFSAMCADVPVAGACSAASQFSSTQLQDAKRDKQGEQAHSGEPVQPVQPGEHVQSGEPVQPQQASPVHLALHALDCDSLQKPGPSGPEEGPKGSAAGASVRPVRQASEGNAVAFHQMTITPKAISYYWRHPRLLQKEDILRVPLSSKHPATRPSAALSSPGKARRKKPLQLAGKTKRAKEKKEENKKKAKPQPKTDAPRGRRKRRQDDLLQSMQEMRKKRGKRPKPALRLPHGHLPQAKPKRERGNRTRQPQSPEAIRKKNRAMQDVAKLRPRPKAVALPAMEHSRAKQPAGALKHDAKNKPAEKAAKKAAKKTAKEIAKKIAKKKAKKKTPAYFILEMLGLLARRKRNRRFSHGPAVAGS